MSISVADIMTLPSLQDAKVVAGYEGMNRAITSISVLELDDPEVLGFDVYGHTRNFGSEIMITAFTFCRNNVELQCETIRRLKNEGEVALIIFYVGNVLPKVDQKVINLANALEMPIIVMPEGRMELRYSDVICEVMEAVVKDREENAYFAAELIEQVSHLHGSERSIQSVLLLIREWTHCSIFLLDEADELLNYVEWPNKRNLPIHEILLKLDKTNPDKAIQDVHIDDRSYSVQRSRIACEDTNLNMVIVKEKDSLTLDNCNQINYVVKTYLNLWTENYGKLNTKQLISAIINDEPEKMRLIADKLKINMKGLSYTYFLFNKDRTVHDYHQLKIVRDIVKDFVAQYKREFLVDIFGETIVVIADRKKEVLMADLYDLLLEIKKQGLDYYAAVFDTVSTTAEAKTSYWLLHRYKNYMQVIFPLKDVLTGGELNFIRKCKKQFDQGDYGGIITSKLEQLQQKNKDILLETLETFLLDGDRNILRTSELLYIHENTAKYRIRSLESIFGHKLTRMPEVYDLYFDAALNRLYRASSKE